MAGGFATFEWRLNGYKIDTIKADAVQDLKARQNLERYLV